MKYMSSICILLTNSRNVKVYLENIYNYMNLQNQKAKYTYFW